MQLDKKYDVTRTCEGPLKDGKVIKITLYEDNKPVCIFDNYHWMKKTYEEALTAAGFKDIKWCSIKVSKKGIEKFGSQFWNGYLKQPGVVVFECHKPLRSGKK